MIIFDTFNFAVSSSTFETLNTAENNVGRISSNKSWQNIRQKICCLSDLKKIAQAKDQKCALLFPFLMINRRDFNFLGPLPIKVMRR